MGRPPRGRPYGRAMLKIYEEQMDRLSELRREAFADRVRPLLRRHYPEKTTPMSDGELDRVVDTGCRAAAAHGITRDVDVERYLYLMFELGFDFDRAEPWAAEILGRKLWSGQTRIALLCAIHEGRLFDGPDDAPFFP